MHDQLSFDLPVRTALEREDFFITEANALALAMIDDWQNWPARKLILTGAHGVGKTHLAHVWAAQSGANVVRACELPLLDIPTLASAPIAVEDIPQIAGNTAAQNALFHLHNLVLAEGHSLLLSGVGDVKFWGLTLPDMMSRLQGTPVAHIQDPDDALLMALMAKMFNDRQIMPSLDTVTYLLRHMDRSARRAGELVEALDRASLAQKRPITRALARDILESAR